MLPVDWPPLDPTPGFCEPEFRLWEDADGDSPFVGFCWGMDLSGDWLSLSDSDGLESSDCEDISGLEDPEFCPVAWWPSGIG